MRTVYLQYPFSIEELNVQPTVMALGFFDGIHLGHQKVINTALSLSRDMECECGVLTLDPHPSVVLNKNVKDIHYITPLNTKLNLLNVMGVDVVYVVSFTPELAKLSPQVFVEDFLIKLNVKHVVAGFDYSYGSMGKGTMESMPQHSKGFFTQTVVEKFTQDEEKVSSSLIRKHLSQGEVEEVKKKLGRHYLIEGVVVHGDKRGRTIGFPTANIKLTDHYIIPKLGVYAVSVEINGKSYNGVCNVGLKPTFTNNTTPVVEVHIFDFNKDIYDEKISVYWHQYIRQEQKFPSFMELVEQIEHDKQFAIHYFKKANALT